MNDEIEHTILNLVGKDILKIKFAMNLLVKLHKEHFKKDIEVEKSSECLEYFKIEKPNKYHQDIMKESNWQDKQTKSALIEFKTNEDLNAFCLGTENKIKINILNDNTVLVDLLKKKRYSSLLKNIIPFKILPKSIKNNVKVEWANCKTYRVGQSNNAELIDFDILEDLVSGKDLNNIANHIKNSVESIKINKINEFCMALGLVMLIKKYSKDYSYLTIDCSYNFPIILNSFRPDIVIIYKNILMIFELKYGEDRLNDNISALKCIKYKQYTARLLNCLKFNILSICEIGISYEKNRIVRIAFDCYSRDLVNDSFIKSNDFIMQMRHKKIKRFKKICSKQDHFSDT